MNRYAQEFIVSGWECANKHDDWEHWDKLQNQLLLLQSCAGGEGFREAEEYHELVCLAGQRAIIAIANNAKKCKETAGIETQSYMPMLMDAWQAPERYPTSGHTYLRGFLAGMYAATKEPELLFLDDIETARDRLAAKDRLK